AHELFHPSLNPQLSTSISSHNNNPNNQPHQTQLHSHHQNQHQSQHQNQHHNERQSQRPTRTLLSVLRADEHAILVRKANIGRFGAAWLRPAGVAKTLQGLADEQAEREEVEVSNAREYPIVEMHTLPDTDDPSVNDEHDLDDDIPESDEDGEGGWIDEEDDEDVEEDDHDGQRRPHSPDNGNEVSMVVGRDNMGMNSEGDEDYIPGERNLDDDIPEGMDDSYQHTDTEVEDESSFEEAEGEGEGEAEAEAQISVLDRSVWGTGGEISGLGGSLPPRAEREAQRAGEVGDGCQVGRIERRE
ncbi:hypothetical protein MMC29_001321, partial [Sticta canariensis]|nr:hypothetical protein [Sticta canariensis]